jgi:hypothetical protein
MGSRNKVSSAFPFAAPNHGTVPSPNPAMTRDPLPLTLMVQAGEGTTVCTPGRRVTTPTILFFSAGAIDSGPVFYPGLGTREYFPVMLPIFRYCVFGVFSGLAASLREPFATHVRATAVSWCNGAGRFITSFGVLSVIAIAGTRNPRR